MKKNLVRSKTVSELVEDLQDIKNIAIYISGLSGQKKKDFWSNINITFESICFREYPLESIINNDKTAVDWRRFIKPIWKQLKEELEYEKIL